MTDLIQRPRRLRKSPALRAMFEETTLSLNDRVADLVEEEIDDYKAVEAMLRDAHSRETSGTRN